MGGILNPMSEVTDILAAVERGDARAAEVLLPLVYNELRKLAAQRLAQECPGQTLQATALVHEAYVRLIGEREQQDWNSRGHFFGAAAEAMRRILVDSARRKRSSKRGGGRVRQEFEGLEIAIDDIPEDILSLNDALTKLAESDKKAAELVQLRFFAGLPLPEIAIILGISPRSADRLWAYARAWLYQAVQPGSHDHDNS